MSEFQEQTKRAPVDLNGAMSAYCHSFGNRPEALREWCASYSQADLAGVLAERIDRLEAGIFEVVWTRSAHHALTAAEIEDVAKVYLGANAPEVDEVGLRAILQWVGWMAWHEGCLR